MIQLVLAAAVTLYGVIGALASLLQLRRMRRRRAADDISLAYLSIVAGGYVLWLGYGLAIGNLPLVLVDALGGVAIFATICVAVSLRRRWSGCFRPARARTPRVRSQHHSRRPSELPLTSSYSDPSWGFAPHPRSRRRAPRFSPPPRRSISR